MSSQFSWEVIRQAKQSNTTKSMKGSVVDIILVFIKIPIFGRATESYIMNLITLNQEYEKLNAIFVMKKNFI